ncbi:hypothetical protein RND81_13G210200 [Saponaria officinalis]|uniref:RING-type E3 ubiquitin transferase n=1 Tax=Saponaria officinalis TaxID=3572 RepID=A0AAW1H0P5_SAPOF
MFISNNYFSSSFSQDLTVNNLHYSRKLLLQTPFYQAPAAPPQNYQLYPLSHLGSSRFDTNVIKVLSVLLCALICTLCVKSLVRCTLKCSILINQWLNQNNIIPSNQQKGSSGVDKKLLKTFPVIKCSKDGKVPGLYTECVICLSEFEGGELVRVLPKCHHGFHVMCIDEWLNLHSSCPTCRQSLVNSSKTVVGCQETSSVGVDGVLPLQREDIVRNFRG